MSNIKNDEEEIKEEPLYNKELFNDDLDLINKELIALDDLYDEVKQHYDKVKSSVSRGSLTFIEKQTSNLINLKTAKLNYIKERAIMKKNTVDFGFKDKQIKAQEGTSTDAITEAIYKKITNDFAYNKNSNELNTNNKINEEDIDNTLDNILDDNDIDISDMISEDELNITNIDIDDDLEFEHENMEKEPIEEEIEETNSFIFAYDTNTEIFYKLTEDYEILEELGEDYDIITDSITDEDGNEFLIGGDGKQAYISISVEDE